MPRDLPAGNGQLLVNFDRSYVLRDVYFPHVGQENHTIGHPNRFGVWVDGGFAWLDSDEWRREMCYQDATLVTRVVCTNDRLGLELVCADCVDFDEMLYLKRVAVRDLAGHARQVRLFQHLDAHLWGNSVGDTVEFDPDHRALIAYKARRYLWLGVQVGDVQGFSRWATGKKEVDSWQGTWRDAEDGELSGNPIAQGSVDCTGGVDLTVAGGGTAVAYFWIACDEHYDRVRALHEMVTDRGPESFITRTYDYWHLWVHNEKSAYADLPDPVIQLHRQSLLILRTQIDDDGAIVAANDSDILHFDRDTYSYMWPRDGALVAHAMGQAGYGQVTRRFFDFCARAIRQEGYLLHKYNPDGSLGSSWHPWIAPDGAKQLPIQEDETALVVWALWNHFRHFRDIEFIKPLYERIVRPAADFMSRFREPHTGLPAPSYDLWEERHGIHSYTTAAVVAGLETAASFASAFGERERAATYRRSATEIRAAARKYLFDRSGNSFLRMINVRPNGTVEQDHTMDASVTGVVQFGLVDPRDPMALSTRDAVERRLWCRTEVGGLARYENDYYQQVSQDLERVPGNPWFVCTLWLADCYTAAATRPEDLARPKEILEWVARHALPSGVLAEQVHPYTGEPLSVSPLTWSHAAFVESVGQYVDRWTALSRAAMPE